VEVDLKITINQLKKIIRIRKSFGIFSNAEFSSSGILKSYEFILSDSEKYQRGKVEKDATKL